MENAGAIIVAILALAALIVIHELGHFLAARLFNMRVKRFSVGFFKPLVEWKPRGSETTYAIGALPLGGYVQVDGLNPAEEVDPDDRRSYANQPGYARLAMIVAGPAANFLSAALVFIVLLNVGLPVPQSTAEIGRTLEGRPAAQSGLRPGDKILSVGDQPVESWHDMANEIRQHPGEDTAVEIERDGETLELTVRPDADSGLIGITPSTQMVRTGPIESVGQGFALAGAHVADLTMMLGRMISGRSSTENVAGPVGIVGFIVEAWHQGWRAFLALLAQLSLSLFLLNFLPIPALDGGRVIFLAVETITRRPVNRKIEGYIHAVGFVLVLGLVLLVTFRDVLHLL